MIEDQSTETSVQPPAPPPDLQVTDEEACRRTLQTLLLDPKVARKLSEQEAGEIIESIGRVLTESLCGDAGTDATIRITLCLQILSKLCRGEALVKATSNFTNVVICAGKGICEVVTAVLAAHAAHPEIAELCGLLTMILASDNTANQVAFAKAGACAHLVLAIKHNIDHASIMDILLRACRNLASNLPIASELISAGVSEQIVDVATKYLDNAEVIEATLWLIVNLSCDADAATILGALGVCSIVTDILARWIDNADIAQGGCWATRNLACVEAANYAVISNTNVVPLLIAVLSAHKENAKVSECTLWALANVGYDQELSVKILEAGLIPVLRDVAHIILTREREHSPAMFAMIAMDDAFLWAVRNISAASEGNNLHFNEPVIQQCVVILLREHDRDPKFAEAAMGAIGNLIHNNDAACSAMAAHFMVEAVAQTTCGYFSDEIVFGTGLKSLYFMCKVHHVRMKEIGLDKVGAAAIKAYPNNDEIIRYGCEILLNVYYTDESSRAALLAAKAIDANGRVAKIASVEDRNEAWIPEAQVKANAWFTAGGSDDVDDEDGKPSAADETTAPCDETDSVPA